MASNVTVVIVDAQQQRRSRRRLAIRYGVLGVALLFVLTTVRMIVFPKIDDPRPVDAIFMLGGPGKRLDKTIELARSGIAPVVVISLPGTNRCPDTARIGRELEIICFWPDPRTTQGEAQEAGRLARERGWNSILFVTDRSQDSRARLRIGRCYDGEVLVDVVETPLRDWPYLFAYQVAATVKAVVWQRDC
ncbi:YdcF family protein [Frankia sp. CcI49]|uniref:YdcF family protein n=1 Tax=Frankia sp. CcI49 TaxID=1745382 RepID=UPI000B0792D9|nr:YdcF family protein [Frankia sp. CcI49]